MPITTYGTTLQVEGILHAFFLKKLYEWTFTFRRILRVSCPAGVAFQPCRNDPNRD